MSLPGDHEQRFGLTGRRALITGSVRGLGWEIALAMAQAGADVTINGRDAAALAARRAELQAQGLLGDMAVFDVMDEPAVTAWFDAQDEAPDILVNNAGLRFRAALEECTPADFQRLFDANLSSAFTIARTWAMRRMAADAGGILINVTSIAGPRARPGDAAYTTAKGGLEALTRSLAVELGPKGFRVNAVAPGYFATEANDEWVADADVTKFVEARIPYKRWGQPSEIAGAAVFLAADAASYINGHVLVIDGGMTINF